MQIMIVDYGFCIRADEDLNILSVTRCFDGWFPPGFSTIVGIGEDMVFCYPYQGKLMFLRRGTQTPERLFEKEFVSREEIHGSATFKYSVIRDLLPTPAGLLVLTDDTLWLVPELKDGEATVAEKNAAPTDQKKP